MPRPPRDPEQLLTEMDARIRLRDQREMDRLRRELAGNWQEPLLLSMLLVIGVGVTTTLWFLAEPGDLLLKIICFWVAVATLTAIFGLEFLIRRIRVLRRMNERLVAALEDQEKSIRSLRSVLPPPAIKRAEPGGE